MLRTYSFSFKLLVPILLFLLPALLSCKPEYKHLYLPGEEPEEEETYLPNPDAANCYIAKRYGTFSFPAYKGNSFIPVEDINSVEVLWESFGTSTAPSVGSLIKNVVYTPAQEEEQVGTISYTVPNPMNNGNAVIAAKDAGGKILWSWHIWLCKDYDPDLTAQPYFNDAGIMMDRNLGATSATPGDVGALGLLYQWGRKDPFLGSSSISASTQAVSTGTWDKTLTSEQKGKIEYAIEHPMTFIASYLQNGDWLYGESEWYRTYSTDLTRWGAKKTIYDPCPQGWRVPDEEDKNNIWSNALGSTESLGNWGYDLQNYGINFYVKFGSSDPIWYPLGGYLHGLTGQSAIALLMHVKEYGFWWSCGGKYSLYIEHYNTNSIRPSYSNWASHAHGHSVRCQKDVQAEEEGGE